jgi:dTDP-4-dehydrorhamnose reductase
VQKLKILITGSSGLLGNNLRYGLEKEFEVVGIARKNLSGYVDYSIDITNHEAIKELVSKLEPNVIIHSAAVVSHSLCDEDPVLAKKVNLESTVSLANIAEEVDAKFIFISTDAVFKGDRGWYQETDEPDPFSYYGELKLMAEQEIAKVTDNFITLRGSFFGKSLEMNKSIFEFFYYNLLKSKQVNGYLDIYSNSIDVINLSAIIKVLIAGNEKGLFHYGSSDKYSKHDLGLMIARLGNLDGNLIRPVNSSEISNPYFTPRDLSLSTTKLETVTGMTMPTLEESVKNVYEFFRK